MRPTHAVFRIIKKYSAIVIIVSIVAVATLIGLTYFVTRDEPLPTIVIAKGTIREQIEVTGSVEPLEEADLSFERSGTIDKVYVRVGDEVPSGTLLASLRSEEDEAARMEARALLEKAEADLSLTINPVTREELAQKTQNVTNAEASYAAVVTSLVDGIRNTDTTLSDAISIKLSDLFAYTQGRYALSFPSCDQVAQSNVENDRLAFDQAFTAFQAKSGAVTSLSSEEKIKTSFGEAMALVTLASLFLEQVSSLLSLPCNNGEVNITSYRSSTALGRTAIISLLGDLSSKRSSLVSAENALLASKRDLTISQTASRDEEVASKKALVSQARANLMSRESALRKNFLYAPISGIISTLTFTPGESVTNQDKGISLISSSGFQVKTKIRELDITKVRPGQEAFVYLDAYGDSTVFSGVVIRVDPSPTVEGTVPLYTALIGFREKSDLIHDGMTAEVHIITAKKDNAIMVPPAFIVVTSNNKGLVKIVTTVEGVRTVTEREVLLGVRGENGFIEAVSGIAPGDILEAPTLEKGGSQKGNSNRGEIAAPR